MLSAHASQNLQKARADNDYQLFARALYGFQESLALWKENHRARLLLTETQRDYAASALDKGLIFNAVTPTALRLAPWLLLTEAEIDEAMWILAAALDEVGAASEGPAT